MLNPSLLVSLFSQKTERFKRDSQCAQKSGSLLRPSWPALWNPEHQNLCWWRTRLYSLLHCTMYKLHCSCRQSQCALNSGVTRCNVELQRSANWPHYHWSEALLGRRKFIHRILNSVQVNGTNIRMLPKCGHKNSAIPLSIQADW